METLSQCRHINLRYSHAFGKIRYGCSGCANACVRSQKMYAVREIDNGEFLSLISRSSPHCNRNFIGFQDGYESGTRGRLTFRHPRLECQSDLIPVPLPLICEFRERIGRSDTNFSRRNIDSSRQRIELSHDIVPCR